MSSSRANHKEYGPNVHLDCPYPGLGVPKAEDGYTLSFTSDQTEEIKDFFWKYGFVVVRDALSNELIEESVDSIWAHHLGTIKRDQPETWATANWKSVYGSNYNANHGFLGFSPAYTKPAWEVRQNPKVYAPFAAIFEREDLWLKFDRVGFMRPTRNIMEDGKLVDKPEWKTNPNFVHWDHNPGCEPNFARVQCVVTLTEHTETSGGFHCIPGVPRHLRRWAKDNKDKIGAGCLISVPEGDPMLKYLTRITMHKGSIVIWDSRTPHGNWPNDDDTYRMVQYHSYFPAPDDEDAQHIRETESANMLMYAKGTELTELGKRVAGLSPWPADKIPSESFVDEKSKYSANQNGLYD